MTILLIVVATFVVGGIFWAVDRHRDREWRS